MPEVRMLKDTKWLKKDKKLKKGDLVTVDAQTASRWVFLHIAEYPSDSGQNIVDSFYTELQMKEMKVADLLTIADQNQIPIKPGTPKNIIIKKINQHFNPDVLTQKNVEKIAETKEPEDVDEIPDNDFSYNDFTNFKQEDTVVTNSDSTEEQEDN